MGGLISRPEGGKIPLFHALPRKGGKIFLYHALPQKGGKKLLYHALPTKLFLYQISINSLNFFINYIIL